MEAQAYSDRFFFSQNTITDEMPKPKTYVHSMVTTYREEAVLRCKYYSFYLASACRHESTQVQSLGGG